MEEQFQQAKQQASLARRREIDLKVYWHVISKNGTENGGNIPTAAIEKQMQRLNTDFTSTGISWTLASTTRTVNETWWFSIGSSSPEQTAMKQALRRGSRADLNIYSVNHIHDSNNEALRGYATMPGDYDKNPKDDGVVFMIRTLPSPYGWLPNYNMGRTLVHEVGHWVGLYHTFNGGCDGDGDYVADTPAEAISADGCPVDRDSCPNQPGKDPINNFMDYSYDSCMSTFTPGQAQRASDVLSYWRKV